MDDYDMYLFLVVLLKNLYFFVMLLEEQDFEPFVEHEFGIKVRSQMVLLIGLGLSKNEERI